MAGGNDRVVPCDIANVPLDNDTLDVAIFCLSLMGTNVADFVAEAHRTLKPGGLLLIAEVRSRFETVEEDNEGYGGGDDDDDEYGGGRAKGGYDTHTHAS